MPIYEDLGVALRLVFSDSPDDCEHRYHLNKQSHSMKAHQNHNSCCTCTQCERKEASPVQFENSLSTQKMQTFYLSFDAVYTVH